MLYPFVDITVGIQNATITSNFGAITTVTMCTKLVTGSLERNLSVFYRPQNVSLNGIPTSCYNNVVRKPNCRSILLILVALKSSKLL